MNLEFKVVRGRRNKKQKHILKPPFLSEEDDCSQSVSKITRIIKSAEQEINLSSYYVDVLHLIQSQLEERCLILEKNTVSIDEILCYGIGSFSTSVSSRYQFALLLNLCKHFKSDVFVYDPIFNKTELSLLKDTYGFNLIAADEKGKRKICENNKLKLVYFPHCPHWLVNNFLWKNWDINLSNCFIFSNSFSEIIDNSTQEVLNSNLRYLYKISVDCVKDLQIENSFKFNDVFNSLSLHIFPEDQIVRIIDDSSFELTEPSDQVEE